MKFLFENIFECITQAQHWHNPGEVMNTFQNDSNGKMMQMVSFGNINEHDNINEEELDFIMQKTILRDPTQITWIQLI